MKKTFLSKVTPISPEKKYKRITVPQKAVKKYDLKPEKKYKAKIDECSELFEVKLSPITSKGKSYRFTIPHETDFEVGSIVKVQLKQRC